MSDIVGDWAFMLPIIALVFGVVVIIAEILTCITTRRGASEMKKDEMKKNEMKTIIIRRDESVWESWAGDAGSLVFALAVFTPGYLTGMGAMQWAGAVLLFIVLVGIAMKVNHDSRKTIAEARAMLDELERKEIEELGEMVRIIKGRRH